LRRITALGAALLTALVVTSVAMAHAKVAPPIIQKGTDNVFTVAVPTESESTTTTMVELTVPEGFGIDAVMQAPGWQISTQKSGSGENADITKITWSGGNVPSDMATNFEFVGGVNSAKSYTFTVRQTYSDGTVVDWSGPESSDTPAPVVEAKSDLGGGGGTSIVTWIALVLGAAALVLGIVALVGRGGGGGTRELA
jgi:uncharacterized protein YcnI